MSTSIRSPGPYGGSPDTNSSRMSSATSVPGCWTRYGTTTRRRRSRSEAFGGLRRSAGGNRLLQAADDLAPQVLGLHDHRVGPERQDPGREPLPRAVRHGDLHPPGGALADDLGALQALRRPPRHLGRERHGGPLLGLPRAPGADLHVVGGPEALGRSAALALV